ncbi:MAG: TolC family protein, partial [Planctomycetes bacterium]|nr:TolC family protein [Planctomycetota bacterium]
DLRALVESYDESEHELELVHLSHAFWPRFMQLAVGGLTSRTNVGLDGGIELPIFDSGAADIAVAEARRGRARATYRAALHGLRSEIRQAVLAYQEQQRRRRFLSDRLEPSLQQAEELLRTGFESGAIDPLKLVDIETRVWDARRAGTEATFGLEQARAHLAATIGRVFESR